MRGLSQSRFPSQGSRQAGCLERKGFLQRRRPLVRAVKRLFPVELPPPDPGPAGSNPSLEGILMLAARDPGDQADSARALESPAQPWIILATGELLSRSC